MDVGEGVLTDKGFFSYKPRYSVVLPPNSLSAASTKLYALEGLPEAEYRWVLVVNQHRQAISDWKVWEPIEERLRSARVAIEVEISNPPNNMPVAVDALIRPTWAPGHFNGQIVLSHSDLSGVRLSAVAEIEMKIEISNQYGLADISLSPILYGGGFDL